MSQSVQPIEVGAFIDSLRNRAAQGVYSIALDGGNVPISVRLRETSNLVFTFSGAVDRHRHPLPCFTATDLDKRVPASVIAVADPSLIQGDDLKLAWYAGHEGFALQRIFPVFVERIIEALGATRVIFTGGSGGGFGALYYSWQTPGSIALVSNPQTNLARCVQAHRDKYRAACWPALDQHTPLDTVIDTDLCALYAERCDNTVIYLQEATDFHHLRQHFAPFVTTMSRDYFRRMTIRMENWGRRGHHPAPPNIWIPWMHAALTAPDTTAVSIEGTWSSSHPSASLPAISKSPSQHRNIRDDQIAAQLARAATSALLSKQTSERKSF